MDDKYHKTKNKGENKKVVKKNMVRSNFQAMVVFSASLLLIYYVIVQYYHSTKSASSPNVNYTSITPTDTLQILDVEKLARDYFGNDWGWYYDNIPFLEIDHEAIQQVYYYRCQLMKMHIHDIGKIYVITEFTPHVDWATPITSTINAAAGHHIYEGRWIRNRRYFDDYITYWFNGVPGLKDFDTRIRQYSFWIADSMHAYFQANGDSEFPRTLYEKAKQNFQSWIDERFDDEMNLFWQVPVQDASEYSVSGIEVDNGWEGSSYRPSINSYMYAESKALAFFAKLFKDISFYRFYKSWESHIQKLTQDTLWDQNLEHFTDRFQKSYTEFNTSFNGYRELQGFIPWAFNLPSDGKKYDMAWEKLNDPYYFRGKKGLRTVEQRFPYYLKQYRPDKECQWNGFSWPFHTTFVLDGMANILNNYKNIKSISQSSYFEQFELYTQQHYQESQPYVGEDLQPETGEWYSNFQNRSEHYFHSQYINLIITGLIGLRPRSDNNLEINPQIPTDKIRYFALQNIPYHGHNLSLVYDTINRYSHGNGFKTYLNDKLIINRTKLEKVTAKIPSPTPNPPPPKENNLALNLARDPTVYPVPSASFSAAGSSPFDAIDGFVWNESYPQNQWNCNDSKNSVDWFELDFGAKTAIRKVALQFVDDSVSIRPPKEYRIQYLGEDWYWKNAEVEAETPDGILGGALNIKELKEVRSKKIRALFTNQGGKVYTGLAEFQVF